MFQRHWNMLKRDYARYLNEEKFSLLRLAKASRRIPGLHYMLWFRLAAATQNNRFPAAHRYCCHHLKAVGYKYGFDIPWDTSIGAGFVIKHFGLLRSQGCA